MKEIKFRAWDNVKGCMYYLGEDENVVFAFVSSGIIATDITEREDEFSLLHHLQYMQYTGLKDCYDVKIFEDDVVMVAFHTGKTTLCKVVYNSLHARFEYVVLEMPIITYSVSEVEEVAVIGNIYQNKELLEGE